VKVRINLMWCLWCSLVGCIGRRDRINEVSEDHSRWLSGQVPLNGLLEVANRDQGVGLECWWEQLPKSRGKLKGKLQAT